MTDIPSYPGMPRWAKIAGILGVMLCAFLVFMLVQGDGHGPSRHMPSADHPAGGH